VPTYRIRYLKSARGELEESCGIYGAGFSDEVNEWLQQIAATAERDEAFSLNVQVALENPDAEMSHLLNHWREAGWIERIAALLTAIRERRPPWQIRMRTKWFSMLGGVFNCELHTIYHLDHVANEVIFVKFDGLPGQ
jgi:hypothetical protein